ncbi:MAG: VOC family protein [bacterium]|nr:VOC family protein [bacterium]
MKIKGYNHVGINVTDMKKSVIFYDKILTYLGFKKVHDEVDSAGWWCKEGSLWLHTPPKTRLKNKHSEFNPGPQHIAFRAAKRKDVDDLYEKVLKPNRIKVLYGGPAEYPEYDPGYYAVFFKDPDGVKLELMWLPE